MKKWILPLLLGGLSALYVVVAYAGAGYLLIRNGRDAQAIRQAFGEGYLDLFVECKPALEVISVEARG